MFLNGNSCHIILKWWARLSAFEVVQVRHVCHRVLEGAFWKHSCAALAARRNRTIGWLQAQSAIRKEIYVSEFLTGFHMSISWGKTLICSIFTGRPKREPMSAKTEAFYDIVHYCQTQAERRAECGKERRVWRDRVVREASTVRAGKWSSTFWPTRAVLANADARGNRLIQGFSLSSILFFFFIHRFSSPSSCFLFLTFILFLFLHPIRPNWINQIQSEELINIIKIIINHHYHQNHTASSPSADLGLLGS